MKGLRDKIAEIIGEEVSARPSDVWSIYEYHEDIADRIMKVISEHASGAGDYDVRKCETQGGISGHIGALEEVTRHMGSRLK